MQRLGDGGGAFGRDFRLTVLVPAVFEQVEAAFSWGDDVECGVAVYVGDPEEDAGACGRFARAEVERVHDEIAAVDVEVIEADGIIYAGVAFGMCSPAFSGDEFGFAVVVNVGERHFVKLGPIGDDVVASP